MGPVEIIILNFSETRRRSIKLWEGIPPEHLHWKPDAAALTIIEMIRHTLETEHLFHKIIENRGNLGNYRSPWEHLEFIDLKNELRFSETYHVHFLNMLKKLNPEDLEHVRIERTEVGQRKKLGDYLNRMVYHEAVHTGQMLGYLRTLGIDRPLIWD